MCGIFGFTDYGNTMTAKRRQKLLHTLARESEARGTDASGIAYCSDGRVRVYKRPVPGGRLWFRLPRDASAVIGHTRMATQGSAKHNYNNHPFKGSAGIPFALTHNGVLSNDLQLRGQCHLPGTAIQTDSYVAVQLIERAGEVSFDSLREMAEAVRGMFTFALLDADRSLWFVKGRNPLVIARFDGLFVYASTPDILAGAIRRCPWLGKPLQTLEPEPGDLLEIDRGGRIVTDAFLMRQDRWPARWPAWDWYDGWDWPGVRESRNGGTPLDGLLAAANGMGYSADDIEYLLEEGYDEEEIEEMLYEPELLNSCIGQGLCLAP